MISYGIYDVLTHYAVSCCSESAVNFAITLWCGNARVFQERQRKSMEKLEIPSPLSIKT